MRVSITMEENRRSIMLSRHVRLSESVARTALLLAGSYSNLYLSHAGRRPSSFLLMISCEERVCERRGETGETHAL